MGLFAVNSTAGVQFVNPNRILLADNNQGSAENQAVTASGNFIERLTTSWVSTEISVKAPAWADAYKRDDYFSSVLQDSTIGSDKIYAKGFAEEWNPFYHSLPAFYSQSSYTVFSVDIVVDTTSTFILAGTLNAWGDTGGTEFGHYYTQVKLFDQSETIYAAGMDTYQNYGGWWESDRIAIEETIVLNPGTYSFYAIASSVGQYGPCSPNAGIGGGGYAYFDVELVPDVQIVPEPACASMMILGGLALLRKRK